MSLQKFPRDGVKKLVIQMEKQKLVYEERALVALQKVTQEKTEALSKAETMQVRYLTFLFNYADYLFGDKSVLLTYCSWILKTLCIFFFPHQEALITAKAEAQRWQSLCEELKLNSGQLRENQHLSNEQLQQLHSQVEVRYSL